MKRILLTLTLFIIGLTLSNGQQLIPLDEKKYINQLNLEISEKHSDSTQIINTLLLSDYWAQKDSVKSYTYLLKAQQQLKQNNSLKKYYNYFWGIYKLQQGKKKEAIDSFTKSIDALKPYNDSLNNQILALSYYQQNYIQLSDKGYQSIVQTITNQCIPLAQKIKNKELEAYFYTQLGLAFMSVGQFDKADIRH